MPPVAQHIDDSLSGDYLEMESPTVPVTKERAPSLDIHHESCFAGFGLVLDSREDFWSCDDMEQYTEPSQESLSNNTMRLVSEEERPYPTHQDGILKIEPRDEDAKETDKNVVTYITGMATSFTCVVAMVTLGLF